LEQCGRCGIPDWFEQLRDRTQQELHDAHQVEAARSAERERLEADLRAARSEVDRLEQPTRAERDELLAAQQHVDTARRLHEAAEHRLLWSGRRSRRDARRDLAATGNQLTWAIHTLEKLREGVARG
jgi:hypothetical protein